jgi:DNA mismatch repair ATPase MutS
VLALVLGRFERESFAPGRLSELQSGLSSDGHSAAQEIARLRRLIEYRDWELNQMFAVIAKPLLWSEQFAVAIENWRARHGRSIRGWLAAIGELEALSSLAGYAAEHPDDPFPGLATGGPLFDGHSIAHPLLPVTMAVRNDVRLDRGLSLLLVSGSNMSGKSTLLRAVGLNTVLAWAGAPVRAMSLRISPLAVGASMRLQDSVLEGRSRFYAEIMRIRLIMDLAARPVPLLFLLDEILSGTNSHDRRIGAEAVIRTLVVRGAVGLVTTHDLALSHIAEALDGRAANVHFEDQIEDGKIVFDYRMRPGIVTKSNALELMRSVGLEV